MPSSKLILSITPLNFEVISIDSYDSSVESALYFFVVVPIAALSIGLTKWGMKWQNDRYVRSAKNVDDIEILSEEIKQLKKRIEELENK